MRIDGRKLQSLIEERCLTQTELGKLAGLARPTIGRLLQESSTQIHPSTERKLSQALGLPIGSLDADNLSTQYLSAVARTHEALDLTGLGLIQNQEPIPMDLAYAPLSVRRRHVGGNCEPRAYDRSIQMRGEQTTMPLSRALELSKSIFLLGPPGSGKTTSLRHIARAYAQGRQEELLYPKSQLVPVVVRLASLAEHLQIDKSADLFAVAISELELHDSEATVAWLHACASSGNVLFLLDGLDEVPDPDQQALVLECLRPILRKYKEACAVITSREVGFDFPNLRPDFDVYLVEPLTRNVIEKFIGTWQASRHHHQPSRKCKSCEQNANRLQHAIFENTQVRALAGNPMILTILCLLHEAGAALPRRRCELYEKISETFLFCWEEKKRKAGAAASDRALTLENREVLWALESLALHMQENDITLFPRFLLLQHFNTFLRDELGLKAEDARLAADTLTWSLQARSGLLRELGPERYGFSHRAFQEYFAARAILSHADPLNRLRPYLYHPGWHEVVRLVAAQLDRRRAPQLIRMLLDDPDPTGRFLSRGLLLALEC
ncbi:MAG: NACHT domain-containing protein, partial [Planctomycetes bacterium]|nr:NACHT domain-containing protein [Planctomycetota bacterium]